MYTPTPPNIIIACTVFYVKEQFGKKLLQIWLQKDYRIVTVFNSIEFEAIKIEEEIKKKENKPVRGCMPNVGSEREVVGISRFGL